ncbi:hypothetical protein [Sphingomonas yabuuchiae]|uniref:hypothetical protein n=1 Tax=Sphingomonas yabuuchiae TaxID=172044 RepID=UPI003D968153
MAHHASPHYAHRQNGEDGLKEAIGFSSEGMDEDLAFDGYRQLYAKGADVIRLDGPFCARVTGWRFRHMLLFDRHLSGMAHVREERVQADGFDHIVLHHALSGSVHRTDSDIR